MKTIAFYAGRFAILSLCVLAAGPVSAGPSTTGVATVVEAAVEPAAEVHDRGNGTGDSLDRQTIDAVADKVADWQLATLDDLGYIRNPRSGDFDRRGWQHGALYVGLMRWGDLPGNERFLEALEQIAEQNEWRLGDRLFHADDHVVGQLYLHLYGKEQDRGRLEHTIAQLNQVLAAAPDGSLAFEGEHIKGVGRSCQLRWCWCDALFMGPPTWFGLALVTGDEAYMAFADAEFKAARDYLMDPETHLFFRDSRYLERRDEDGRKIFWSRGNGWVYAGVVNILRLLPDDHPLRAGYLELYLAMSKTIAGLQQANGLWRVSLLGGEQFAVPETSGSAFMTYGLAWGVNHGLLDADAYAPVVTRGWEALVDAVQDDGKLGWVQPVGFAPDSVFESDSHLYGVGAFLLAAEQMFLRAEGK